MDAWLASVYGTGGGDDLEKTAQSLLLEKLAAEENLDLSGLTQEQLDALAAEVLAGEKVEEEEEVQAAGGTAAGEPAAQQAAVAAPGAQAGDAASLAKEAQAKFEEADFLGRVMAHAYTNELSKIASAASALKGAAGKAGAALKGAAHKVGETASKIPHKGIAGAAVGGAAAGAAAHHMATKTASAFEKLAEMRAAEILQENGIDPATGAPAQQAAQPSNEDKVNQAVDARAKEILESKGYTFEGEGGQAAAAQAGGVKV